MAVAGFNQLLQTMAEVDAFTGILPFILTYVILYAALENVPVISEKDQFPPLIAIIGAFFVARFIVVNPFYQSFFIDYFGRLVVGLVGFIGLLVLLAFTGFDLEERSVPLLMFVMVAIAGSAFTAAGGFGPPWNFGMLTNYDLAGMFGFLLDSGLIWIIVVLGAIAWVSKEDKDGGGSGNESDMKKFLKWMVND